MNIASFAAFVTMLLSYPGKLFAIAVFTGVMSLIKFSFIAVSILILSRACIGRVVSSIITRGHTGDT